MRYNIGDKLRVIDRKHGHKFEMLEIVEVVRLLPRSGHVCQSLTRPTEIWAVEDHEVDLVEAAQA